MSELERAIAKMAETDGQFAIAHALLQVAYQLKCLGTSDASTTMGAIEFLATHIGEKLDGLRDSLRTDHPLMGETLEGVTSALSEIADAIKDHVRPAMEAERTISEGA